METDISDVENVATTLDKFHNDPESAPLSQYMDQIDDHFDYASIESIIKSLKSDGSEWAARQVKLLKKSRAEVTSASEQLERETTAANNSCQQQLDRINSSKPHERAAAFQELQSFEQDALNCICYCTGLEIDLFSTSPTATARYTVKAAV